MFANTFRGRRVLVTGHTGFKGSWLCQWLLELGAEVAGFSLYVPTVPSHFEALRLSERIVNYEADIRDFAQLKGAIENFRPSAVFHMAAQPIVRASFDDPKLTFDTNLGGTVNLLEALRSFDFVEAAVVITSDKCYENVEWEYGYRESDRLGGKDPYSASKACAEMAFSAYARSFFKSRGRPAVVSARAGNVIGGGDWASGRIVPDCVRAWAQGKSALIRCPHSTRPWQHVLEPLSGYLWLAVKLLDNADGLTGESFNFGPRAEVNHSVQQLLQEMAKTWRGVSWQQAAVAAENGGEAALLKLNCDKALNRLQWVPTLNFEEGVRMTTEWYLEFNSSPQNAPRLTSHQIRTYQDLALDRGCVWTQI